MIASLSGVIQYKRDQYIIIQVNGIGYSVLVNQMTASSLGNTGDSVDIITYLDVKEDSLTLFGFLDMISYELFKKFISVNGVGAKSALLLLDLDKPEALIQAIRQENTHILSQASGIGKKTAERIVLELRDKVDTLYTSHGIVDTTIHTSIYTNSQDVWDALESLGYKSVQIQRILPQIDATLDVSEQIRLALKLLQT
jgi:Holliday junction DNA helicase RuvA